MLEKARNLLSMYFFSAISKKNSYKKKGRSHFYVDIRRQFGEQWRGQSTRRSATLSQTIPTAPVS
jgi:hypothetical protein